MVEASPARCSHLDSIAVRDLPGPPLVCEECVKIDAQWMHLRMCTQCGKVGCCDNSLHRHATAHFEESGHAIIRSAEPYEEWMWCYVDKVPIFGVEG